jgi:uncharacterized short protein YbdD (DUF466 family)
VTSPSRAGSRWRRLVRGLHWYLRELTGEADYDRYLDRHAVVHPGCPVMNRRDFERWRVEQKASTAGHRCC